MSLITKEVYWSGSSTSVVSKPDVILEMLNLENKVLTELVNFLKKFNEPFVDKNNYCDFLLNIVSKNINIKTKSWATYDFSGCLPGSRDGRTNQIRNIKLILNFYYGTDFQRVYLLNITKSLKTNEIRISSITKKEPIARK